MYQSTKTYGHDLGLSVCFRQHRASHSHCSKLHGYAIAVKLTFGCNELDDKNWVQDFGALKPVKEFLMATFDHKLVVARDDPEFERFWQLNVDGVADVVALPAVGCEAFAKYIFDWINNWASTNCESWIESVEVMEHGANSAIYTRSNLDQ